MTGTISTIDALNLWHRVTVRSLRELPNDLSQRQIGVLLTVYLNPTRQTIRSLSEQLKVSKPAICRAVDALTALDLLKRKKDEEDKRNVFLQRTIAGSVFLRDFADLIVDESSPKQAANQSRCAYYSSSTAGGEKIAVGS